MHPIKVLLRMKMMAMTASNMAPRPVLVTDPMEMLASATS